MKDHSQHGEQEHILKFFGDRKGRFLDIGAFDGVTGSNTRALVELGWTGVCVEANPLNFVKLLESASAQVQCVNAAVAGERALIAFKDAGQLSSGLLDNVPPPYGKRQFHVAAITPAMLAQMFGDKFDFISLDVEGMDLDVLRELAPVSEPARLLCIEDAIPFHEFDAEYYAQLRTAAAVLGFSKVVARTPEKEGTGNTLLAKE